MCKIHTRPHAAHTNTHLYTHFVILAIKWKIQENRLCCSDRAQHRDSIFFFFSFSLKKHISHSTNSSFVCEKLFHYKYVFSRARWQLFCLTFRRRKKRRQTKKTNDNDDSVHTAWLSSTIYWKEEEKPMFMRNEIEHVTNTKKAQWIQRMTFSTF